MTVTFEISSLDKNSFQGISWLSASISLINTVSNYTGNLVGLMGNYNGVADDDVFNRDGNRPASLTLERSVYDIAMSWKLSTSDEDLFTTDSITARATVSNYQPSFFEDLIANNTDPSINVTCNYDQSCIADALTSGLVKFGTNTGSQLQKNTEADAKLNVIPPFIEFVNSFELHKMD